jgi:putative transposase
MIELGHNSISVRRQCQLIGLSRASLYYEPAEESAENLLLMRLLDEQYTRTPFYGVLKMTAWLRENGHQVNCKRVRRLLRLMGLEAIYQKPRLSIPSPGHQVYPYLLRGVKVARVNQVWSAEMVNLKYKIDRNLHQRLMKLKEAGKEVTMKWNLHADNMRPKSGEIPLLSLYNHSR